jgi:hypothetical protein
MSQAEADAIRRMAQAEADAASIRAHGDVRAQEIRERALMVVESNAVRQQENRDAIVRGSLPELPEHVSDQPVEKDWTAEFFDQCENVSDPQMQTIWSKILAGEVAQPGSFSKRTLAAVRLLEKSEAESFTKLCGYVWLGHCEGLFFRLPQVWTYLETKGLYYASLLHFQSIGLLSTEASRIIHHGSTLELNYHGTAYVLTPHSEPRAIPYPAFPISLLTPVGIQLGHISGSDGDPDFPAVVATALKTVLIDMVAKEAPDTQAPPPQPKP